MAIYPVLEGRYNFSVTFLLCADILLTVDTVACIMGTWRKTVVGVVGNEHSIDKTVRRYGTYAMSEMPTSDF